MEAMRHLLTPRKTNNFRPRMIHPDGFFLMTTIALVFHVAIVFSSRFANIGNVLGYASNINADQVLMKTNEERQRVGIQPLSHNGLLTSAAVSKATNMFEKQYWAHVSPDGQQPWEFIKNAGYSYSAAGENLAKDFSDTDSMVSAWMNSPTHRENIVNARFSEIGIAVVNGSMQGVETTIVVQMFGAPRGAVAAKPAVPQVAAATQETTPVVKKSFVSPLPTPTMIPVTVESTPNPLPVSETYLAAQTKQNTPLLTFSAPQAFAADNETGKTPILSPLQLSKALFLSMLILLVAVLFFDLFIARRMNLVRAVGKNMAHIFLFICLLYIVLVFKGGSLLESAASLL